jgi:hypothetical protein
MLKNCLSVRTNAICSFCSLFIILVSSSLLLGARPSVGSPSLHEEMDLPQVVELKVDDRTGTALLSDMLGPQLALLEVVPQLPLRLRDTSASDVAVLLAADTRSGLSWKSGVCGDPGIGNWRGRALDTSWFGLPKSSFSAMIRQSRSSGLRAAASRAPRSWSACRS